MTKVLVVDDEESIREALKDFLEGEGGYEVLLAENGAQALEIFRAEAIELVFMDVKMPGMDGIETFRRMKQIKPGVKTVIITGLPDEKTFDRALAVSDEVVEGFIAKPFKPSDLRKCLRTVKSGDRHAAFQLTPSQLEALGRISEGAVTDVAQALTDIAGKDIAVALTNVNAVSVSRISKPLEEPGLFSAGLVTRLEGDITGLLLLIFTWEGGRALLDLADGLPEGSTKDFNEKNLPRLKAVGSVLSGAYLQAFFRELNLKIRTGPREMVFKHRNALIREIVREMAPSWDEEGESTFALESQMTFSPTPIECWFSLVPTGDSLKSILRKLGTLK